MFLFKLDKKNTVGVLLLVVIISIPAFSLGRFFYQSILPAKQLSQSALAQFIPELKSQQVVVDYVPAELIVRYKEDISSLANAVAASQDDFANLPKTASLAQLQAKYKVKKSEKVFKNYENVTSRQQLINAIKKQRAGNRAAQGKQLNEEAISNLHNTYRLELDPSVDVLEAAAEFLKNPNVELAEPNYLAQAVAVPNDPYYSYQWAHSVAQADLGWNVALGSADTVIAVIDSGVDYTHEDLIDNIYPAMYDFVNVDPTLYAADGYQVVLGEDYATEDADPMDVNGHGTHCAGIVAAKGNNGLGVSGVCPNCQIMALRAGFALIDSNGNQVARLKHSDIAQSIDFAINNGADVISMSIGGPASSLLKNAIDAAYSNDIVLVASAGNSDTDVESYPAAYPNVMSVAASASDDDRAYYSNYGFWVDVAAPGGDYYEGGANGMILSTLLKPLAGTDRGHTDPTGYGFMQGTSMAAPYVAGLAGLIKSNNSALANNDIYDIIKQSADATIATDYIGSGRVNVNEALQYDFAPSQKVKIVSPLINDTLTRRTDISGTAFGQSYVLEYGSGFYPTSWQPISSGAQVTNGALGSWEISSLGQGYYTMRLSVVEGGVTFTDQVVVDVNYQAICTPPDIDCNMNVNDQDLDTLTSLWGSADPVADFDQDGVVTVYDLGIMMARWGSY